MATGMSQLVRDSLGHVAANKDLNSKDIQVILTEKHPFMSGEITDQTSLYGGKGTSAKGQAYEDSVIQTLTVTATWIPMHTDNRTTAPDVRRGEPVQLYRFADSDKYYWTTLDSAKRALETVTYGWNASPTDDAPMGHPDSNYLLQVSAHTKQITLSTSQANGEATAYNLQIDTGNGVIHIVDGEGNSFTFDSVNALIRMLNNQGTLYEVNKADINIFAPNGNVHIIGKTGRFEFQETLDMFIPQTTHRGNFNELGSFGLGGDMVTAAGDGGGVGTPGTGKIEIAGQTKLIGSLDVEGPTTTQSLTAENISTPNPISAPNVN